MGSEWTQCTTCILTSVPTFSAIPFGVRSQVTLHFTLFFFPTLHLNGFPGLSGRALFLLLLILSFLPFIVSFFPSSCFFIFHVSHFVSIVLSPLHLAYFNAILVFVLLQADRHLQTTLNHLVSLHLCIVEM